jgi:XapX domain-containing protein
VWIDLIRALVVGAIVGAVFAILKLPVPAPPTLVGVVGILGIYLGYRLVIILFKI